MKIKENIKSFFTDKIRIVSFLLAIFLCAYHIWQYIESPMLHIMLRVIMYGVFSITILILGLKFLYSTLIIMSLIACYFNSFMNWTSFFVLLLACRMNRSSEKWLLPIYALNESFALIYQGKGIDELVIHIITAAFFYLIYFFINKPKQLILEPDEEEIVKQLANGKMQKEIDLYSKNIIKDKIDHALIRNHLIDKNELINLYRQSHH